LGNFWEAAGIWRLLHANDVQKTPGNKLKNEKKKMGIWDLGNL
jgi:hypothetical protein